jgi:DNA polymerase elongation subunit (family B)
MDLHHKQLEEIYVFTIIPQLLKSPDLDCILIWDVFYFSENDKNMKCLRIYNIELSFLLVKLPTMKFSQFERWINHKIGKYVKLYVSKCLDDNSRINNDSKCAPFVTIDKRENLNEAGFFNFDHKYEYLEIKSKFPQLLKYVYHSLENDLELYYERIEDGKGVFKFKTVWDELFYLNSETPFRFTSFVGSVQKSIYLLPTKFNLPLIGGWKISLNCLLASKDIPKHLKKNSPKDIELKYYIDYQNLSELKKSGLNLSNQIKLITYDIETYAQDRTVKTPEPMKPQNVCFNIGIGFFYLSDPKPYKTLSIFCGSNNKLLNDEFELQTINAHEVLRVCKKVVIDNYELIYINCSCERDVLLYFFHVLKEERPQIINGFNNFGFDDRYIYIRAKLYELDKTFLELFNYYDSSSLNHLDSQFGKVDLKIDGERENVNLTVISKFCFFVDTMKIILKEDSKRFTQYGKGLNAMLKAYSIVNPWTGLPLSKDDMGYSEMWDNFEKNENLLKIAHYCMQDAWITGTLLLSKNKIIDYIELATLSCTSFSDSIYRADSKRVLYKLINCAFSHNFALTDNTLASRKHNFNLPFNQIQSLGGKLFDTRSIIGGQVRNISPGKHSFVVALDYASLYPTIKQANNIDSSSRVSEKILSNPENYGLLISKSIVINDMFGKRKIYYLSTQESAEFSFIVEEFSVEYINDRETISKYLEILKKKNSDERLRVLSLLSKLYPENNWKETPTLNISNIPESTTHSIYFVQNYKRPELEDAPHYSLKEIMLTELAALRAQAKKDMAESQKSGNLTETIRFNAKQNGYKVIMNTEYGATGSDTFAIYDPDIAGAVTATGRKSINYLSHLLEEDTFFVDEKFINDCEPLIKPLLDKEVIKYEEEINTDNLLDKRRLSLRRLFDTKYDIKQDVKIYRLNIKPSKVIYQDTDSNYYVTKHISDSFKDCPSPETINSIMNYMILHNKFISELLKRGIDRPPYAVAFEGAFIVCRFLNRKKKYYGIKWNESMIGKIPSRQDLEVKDQQPSMEINSSSSVSFGEVINGSNYGELQLFYKTIWKPKKYVIPFIDGTYFKVEDERLLKEDIMYIDYINEQGIKATGIDLARRDQCKFINLLHLKILQLDLRVISFDVLNDKWKWVEPFPLSTTINNILADFKEYTREIEMNLDPAKPRINFRLIDFSKNCKFKGLKTRNIASKIVSRLIKEDKNRYIPKICERLYYVIVKDNDIEERRKRGLKTDGKCVNSHAISVQELLDNCGDEIEALSKLDFVIYFHTLAKATALYLIEEEFPEIVARLEDLADKEQEIQIRNIVSEKSDAIAEKLINQRSIKVIKTKSRMIAEKIAKQQQKIANRALDNFYPIRTIPSHHKRLITKYLKDFDLNNLENPKIVETLYQNISNELGKMKNNLERLIASRPQNKALIRGLAKVIEDKTKLLKIIIEK